jgi:hypothetical protein
MLAYAGALSRRADQEPPMSNGHFPISPPLLAAALLWPLIRPAEAAAPTELFVAPIGDEQASGRSVDRPFASLARARDEARALRQSGKALNGVTVWVRGGAYHLTDTLTFGPEDAGVAQAPLQFRAYREEHPVIRGGPALNGFEPYRDKIRRCDLKRLGLEGKAFRQLFFQGKRMPLARTPNLDPADIHGGVWAHVVEASPQGSKRSFTYNPKDLDPSRWARPTDGRVGVFCQYDWRWNWLPIEAVSAADQTLTLGRDATYEFGIGDRYFVEGLVEELDSPGEWYLDRNDWVVYFWPPEPIRDGDVSVPVVGDLLHFKDTHDVSLRGFVLEGCDGNAVRMVNADRCQVTQSVLRNCGAWGASIDGGGECSLVGCDVSATGCGGILLGGGDRKTLAPAKHFAANNVIHHVGVFEKTYNTAINIGGVGNVVRNNLIYDTPHAGLTLAGNDNLVELNVIHHTNLQSTDTGGLYSCPRDWTQRGNVIRHNVWHDLGGFGKRSSWQPVQDGKVEYEYPHFTWGIYMDDPTSGNTMYGNVLYRVPICGMFTHGGRDCVFENNVIVDCPAFQAGMLWPGWDEWTNVYERFRAVAGPGSPYLGRYPAMKGYSLADGHPEAMTGHKFVRNIVYNTTAGTAWLRGERRDPWKGENRMMLYDIRMRQEDLPKNEIDHNCVYAEPGLEPFVSVNLPPQDGRQLSWEDWRKLGVDEHSQFADPRFVDPANHDYRLRDDSPALKLGFKPIPFDKIGPYQDELRASWPVVEESDASRKAQPTKRFVQLPGYEPLPAREFVARGGAGNAFAKLAAGKPVKVAYFGGGIHYADGWRAQALKWLRERYPKSQVTEIDAGICDCVRGSGFSVYRFAHDVLQRQPDLVLIDFASDDHQTDVLTIQRVIEGVVRQAWSASDTWKANPEIDLLFVYAFRDGFERAYTEGLSPATVSAYERVAERYGIPSVNMGFPVAEQSRAGKLVLKGDAAEGKESFSADGVRPSATGNRLYAEALARAFEQLAKAPQPAPHALPKPLLADNYESARLEPITSRPAGRAGMLVGDWKELPKDDPLWPRFARHFDTIWFTNQPGAKLTLTFTGTEASLFDLMGPDTGQVRVTVDGKDAGTRKQVDPWSYYQRLAAIPLASGLPPGEHTVTVELLLDPPDRSVPIAEAKKANRYDPKLFEGVALRVAWVRVR